MSKTIELGEALARTFETNARITEYLLESLPATVWRGSPEGYQGRCIAEIAAHVHNVRRMWLKPLASRAGVPVPAQAERASITPDAALQLLRESAPCSRGRGAVRGRQRGQDSGFSARRRALRRLSHRARGPSSRPDLLACTTTRPSHTR